MENIKIETALLKMLLNNGLITVDEYNRTLNKLKAESKKEIA